MVTAAGSASRDLRRAIHAGGFDVSTFRFSFWIMSAADLMSAAMSTRPVVRGRLRRAEIVRRVRRDGRVSLRLGVELRDLIDRGFAVVHAIGGISRSGGSLRGLF